MTKDRLRLIEFLPYQLSVTSNAVSDLIAQSYRSRFGLKIPEWRVLAILGERDEITQRELVDATAMDKVTINRATKALADRELICRAANSADGRSHHLTLTDAGQSLYAEIVPLALQTEASLEAVLEPGDAKKLENILSRLQAQAIKQLNEN